MTIGLRLIRHRDDLRELISVQGTFDLADVHDTVRGDAMGEICLRAAVDPKASTGDHLRLLAFYCDMKEGRR